MPDEETKSLTDDQSRLAFEKFAFERDQAEKQNALSREQMALEREKLVAEEKHRTNEIALKEREIRRSTWLNPFLLGVVVAVIGLLGNTWIGHLHDQAAAKLEEQKAALEAIRLQQSSSLEIRKLERSSAYDVIKTGDLDKGVERLKVLIALDLYHDGGQVNAYKASGLTSPASTAEKPIAPNTTTISENFQAHSNGVATYRKCFSPRAGHHFEDWRIFDKVVIGDGDAWFEVQNPTSLCVRADASVTAGGSNSSASATVTARQISN